MMFRVIAVLSICGIAAFAEAASEKVVQLSELPQPVQKSIQSKLGDRHLEQIVQVGDNGEVETSRAGRSWAFTIGESGELLDEEVPLAQVPAAAQKTIRAHVANGKIETITKVYDDSDVSYEVAATLHGKIREFTVADNGKVLSFQMYFDELPVDLQAAIKKAAGTSEVGDIYKTNDNGDIAYEVEIATASQARTLIFDSHLRLVSEEQPVALTNTPTSVQKVIKAEVVNGARLTGVTKMTEQGEVTYEVELLKAGKHTTLTIAAGGKIME